MSWGLLGGGGGLYWFEPFLILAEVGGAEEGGFGWFKLNLLIGTLLIEPWDLFEYWGWESAILVWTEKEFLLFSFVSSSNTFPPNQSILWK